MIFEWDDRKREANIKKHGVDFLDAAMIFRNPVVAAADKRTKYGVSRFRALGHVEDRFYEVVFTWRSGSCRIISAWIVGDDGKKRYQALLAGRD